MGIAEVSLYLMAIADRQAAEAGKSDDGELTDEEINLLNVVVAVKREQADKIRAEMEAEADKWRDTN